MCHKVYKVLVEDKDSISQVKLSWVVKDEWNFTKETTQGKES